jgi:hypothetical protein
MRLDAPRLGPIDPSMPFLTPVVADRIWAHDRPVWFSGVRLRARTTVLRLDDGALLIHSPSPPTDELVAELRALGPVRWLVVPNCFHHLGTPAAAATFPDATVVAPASALPRNAALKVGLDLAEPRFAELVPELDVLPLRGIPFLDETVLFHRPTGTLLGADMVLSAHARDHFTWRWAARIMGCYDRLRVPPDVRKEIADPIAAAASVRAMLERPVKRIVVAHADVVEGDCAERLAAAFRMDGMNPHA